MQTQRSTLSPILLIPGATSGVAKREELGAALASLASLYSPPEKPAPPPVLQVAPNHNYLITLITEFEE